VVASCGGAFWLAGVPLAKKMALLIRSKIMGDKANIVMRYGPNKDIFFYGHLAGEDYVKAAQRALAMKWRWDDPAYLARIVWDEFCGEVGDETGYGISLGPRDNEHPYLIIDMPRQRVLLQKEREYDKEGGAVLQEWTFEEFIADPLDSL
jgi:hypothetical protein